MIELHINGKLIGINPEYVSAILPPQRGKGCLICESFESFIQVDETVEEVIETLSAVLDVEMVANDV